MLRKALKSGPKSNKLPKLVHTGHQSRLIAAAIQCKRGCTYIASQKEENYYENNNLPKMFHHNRLICHQVILCMCNKKWRDQ